MGINNPGGGGGLWALLHDETLAVAGKFDVSGISQAHTHLYLIVRLRGDVADTEDVPRVFLNGDTTVANYKNVTHTEGTAHSNSIADTNNVLLSVGNNSPAGSFSQCEAIIYFYSDTVAKKQLSSSALRRDTAAIFYRQIAAYEWTLSDAITQITIQTDNDPADLWVADSCLQIWGFN